jgi:hydrogenase expression/formation protein HypE
MPEIHCPLPPADDAGRIELAHGAGAGKTARLLQGVFYPRLGNPLLDARLDAGVLGVGGLTQLAFTTDSYVVTPWQFSGGSIGDLAVCGSFNDLAMVGARPLALSLGFILEEGFPIRALESIVDDIAGRAAALGVPVAAADTKVVERGKADGVFITASAVGAPVWAETPGPTKVRAADVIILSGDVGRHAIAVQAARQGFVTNPLVCSDVTTLWPVVAALHQAGIQPRCLRDLTRGGLGVALLEIARDGSRTLELSLHEPPLLDGVRAVVEALGLDPFFLANEGRFIAIVDPRDAAQTLDVMTAHGMQPQVIGHAGEGPESRVTVRTPYGSRRYLTMPLSEPLPRIC